MKGPERHGPAVAALSCLDYSLCPRRKRAYLAEIYLLESSAREKAAILFRAPEQGSAKSSDIEIALFHFGSTIRAFHRDLLLRRSNYATNAFTFVLKESVLAPQFTPGQLLNSQPVGNSDSYSFRTCVWSTNPDDRSLSINPRLLVLCAQYAY